MSIAKELPFTIWYSDAGSDANYGVLDKYVGEIKDFIKASSIDVVKSSVSAHIVLRKAYIETELILNMA